MPPNQTVELVEWTQPKAETCPQDQKVKLPTFEEIRRVVPPECYEKSTLVSLFYIGFDLSVLALLYYLVPSFEQYGWPGLVVWYWFMGMFGAGLFVIGHDCGHGTFSNYKWLDIVCGHVCHAPLLASYWPWRKSHRLHHLHTNHVSKDKGHPWNVEEDWRDAGWFARNFARFPLSNFIKWQVIYQMMGVPDGSHYWPWSDLFTTPKERVQCAISTSACFFCATVAFVLCDCSALAWFKYYFVPVLCQGYWLVMITVLQHQDDDTEVYEDGTWTFVRGQLQTIDREYGMGVDTVLHHVTDGHVAHHFFPWKIPHYHLMEATKAIRSLLEEKYLGVYKRRSCYHFVLELIRINVQLEYLIGKGTGLLRYNVHKKECAKTE